MGKPTKRPWRYQREITTGFGEPRRTKFEIYTDGGPYGHPATCDLEEDAELIVRAVNAHQDLVAALTLALARNEHSGACQAVGRGECICWKRDASAALKKAGVE